MTLADFLLARIAEDEDDARRASGGNSGHWTADGASIYDGHPANDVVDWVYDDAWSHIARHDPARVLVECESKRQIVCEHSDGHRCDWGDWYEPGECETKVLRLIATVYADHPDYREEWRP